MSNPERSLSPYNDYQFDCNQTETEARYKLCLHVIDAMTRSNPASGFDRCREAIQRGTCPAAAMRNEELAKGQSLYYLESPLKNRIEPEESTQTHRHSSDKESESYKRGYACLDPKPPKQKQKTTTNSTKKVLAQPIAQASPEQPSNKPGRLPGETISDYIERLRRQA